MQFSLKHSHIAPSKTRLKIYIIKGVKERGRLLNYISFVALYIKFLLLWLVQLIDDFEIISDIRVRNEVI